MITLHTVADPAGLNVKAYGRLLAKFAPRVIQTEQENEHALAIVESLLARGDAQLSAEELALLDLLGHLIERFESKTYITPDGDPAGALQLLMEGRSLKPADLAPVLGSRAKVSEILSGKRAISKAQARRLGEFFKVSPRLSSDGSRPGDRDSPEIFRIESAVCDSSPLQPDFCVLLSGQETSFTASFPDIHPFRPKRVSEPGAQAAWSVVRGSENGGTGPLPLARARGHRFRNLSHPDI